MTCASCLDERVELVLIRGSIVPMSLFLDFEQPIAELQAQIDELRHVSEHNSAVDLNEDIRRLEKKTKS